MGFPCRLTMSETFKEGQGSDEHRYRCLVRHVLKWRTLDRDAVHRWLRGYTNESGRWVKGWTEAHVGSKLEQDVKQQWKLGNRGEYGKWIN